jgi:hypothetical protein
MRWRPLLVLALAAALLGACGSDDDDDGGGDTGTAETTQTDTERTDTGPDATTFIKRATRVCKRLERSLDPITSGNPQTPEAAADLIGRARKRFSSVTAELGALEPPADRKTEWDIFLGRLDGIVRALRNTERAVRRRQLGALNQLDDRLTRLGGTASRAARKAGVNAC